MQCSAGRECLRGGFNSREWQRKPRKNMEKSPEGSKNWETGFAVNNWKARVLLIASSGPGTSEIPWHPAKDNFRKGQLSLINVQSESA